MSVLVRLLLLAACLLPATRAAHPTEAAPPASPIRASDLLQVRSLSAPALSPDGRWVAYVVRW